MLLRAFARLADIPDLHLVICAATPRQLAGPFRRLAAKLGAAPRIIGHHRLSKTELAAWISHAEAAMASLTECSRSLEQGCRLLKARSLLPDTKLDWIPSGIDRSSLLAASSDQEEDPATGSCDPTGG